MSKFSGTMETSNVDHERPEAVSSSTNVCEQPADSDRGKLFHALTKGKSNTEKCEEPETVSSHESLGSDNNDAPPARVMKNSAQS